MVGMRKRAAPKSAAVALERIRAELAGKPLEPGGAQDVPTLPVATAARFGNWKRHALLALALWAVIAPLLAYLWGDAQDRDKPAPVAAAAPAQPDLAAMDARSREWAAVIRAGVREDIEALRPDVAAINRTVAEAVRTHLAARDAKCAAPALPAPRSRNETAPRAPAVSLPHHELLGLGQAVAAAP